MTVIAGVRRAGCVAGLVLVSGCYPALDWREVPARDGGFAILLPAKPQRDTRQVQIGQHALQMSMLSVRIDRFLYGAGYAELPRSLDHLERATLLHHARSALLKNFGANVAQEPGEARHATLDGHPCVALNAYPIVATRAIALSARLCATDRYFYQIVSLPPRDRAADADASLFLGSLRLLK